MNIHVVQPGETLSSIAASYNISEYKLIQDNGLINPNSLVPGQTLVIAIPEQTHTVQQGDSLESIANQYGVTVMELLRNNPFLSERKYIYPGEELVIRYHTIRNISTIGYAYSYIDRRVLIKTLPFLTYLSIYNYRATDEGEIISYYDDSELIRLSKEYDTIPLILITTLSLLGVPDYDIEYKLLLNEEYQDMQINNLINIMREKGFMGVNLIFDLINTSNQQLYFNFIDKVYSRLYREGFLIFISVNPNIKLENGEASFGRIDYSRISDAADAVTFLQFIWGVNNNPPGPVSSIPDLRSFVDYAVTLVPPDKFIIGIPTIAYDWVLPYSRTNRAASSLTIDSAISLANNYGATIQFDEVSQTPFFEYTQTRMTRPVDHIVWMIDARSINALIKLVLEYDLNGTGIWNIMVYSSQLWLLINSQFNIDKFIS